MAMNDLERNAMKSLVSAVLFKKQLMGRISAYARGKRDTLPTDVEMHECREMEGMSLILARKALGI